MTPASGAEYADAVASDSAGSGDRPILPAALDLQALLAEVTDRVQGVTRLADRLQALLAAVVSVSSHLELPEVLQRVTETAAELAGAQYAALGVLDPGGESRLSQFLTVGIDEPTRRRIGEEPHGLGVVGLLMREPRAIRLGDITKHPAHHGFPPGHPPMRTFLGVPISVRGEAFGNLYLTEKHGGEQFTETDEQIVTALASAAGLAVANASLYEQAQRRQQWLEAASAIQTRLLAGDTAAEVFPDLVSTARQLAGADLALLALPSEGGLLVQAADGAGAAALRRRQLADHSLAETVMHSGESAIVSDARIDPRIKEGVIRQAKIGPALYVPLGPTDAPLGTLVVGRVGDGPRFDGETMRLVESFAGQAAIAVQLGSAVADRERLAVLGDRDRIARDLHDLVIQRLFAIGMSLQGAMRGMTVDKAERVQRAVDDLDTTIKEIRTSIFALQTPAPLAGEGIRQAVLAATSGAHESLGFAPSVTFDGPVDTFVDPEVGEQLLAVLREALSNVARHAAASTVTVTVRADVDRVELLVLDDGRGLAEGGRRSGLANLARRAADLGGRFEVAGREPRGTKLCWSVPVGQG